MTACTARVGLFPGLIRAGLLDGLDQSLQLVLDRPALVAEQVADGEVDLELQPVAVLVVSDALQHAEQAAPDQMPGGEAPVLAATRARTDNDGTRTIALHGNSPVVHGSHRYSSMIPQARPLESSGHQSACPDGCR